jgi:hypothetical protein
MEKKKFKFEEMLGNAKKAEANHNFLAASFLFKEALRIARDLGYVEQTKLLKKKLIDINQKSIESMEQHEFKREINLGAIEKTVKQVFAKKNLFTCLCIIGANDNFLPNYQDVLKDAEKSKPLSIMLASYQTISKDGFLPARGDDPSYCWFLKMYGNMQEFILQTNLSMAIDILKKRREKTERLSLENLIKFFIASKFIPEENFEIIVAGFERFFKKDFISALHILIPNLESLFLTLGELAGLDVVALSRTPGVSTQKKVLSERLILSQEFKNIWGEDFCYQYKIVFYDQLGYMFRHKCAHGNLSSGECNELSGNLIFYFYLALISRFYFFKTRTS